MAPKTYHLELTAEEFDRLTTYANSWPEDAVKAAAKDSVEQKIAALNRQIHADREASDLRLPWRAEQNDWTKTWQLDHPGDKRFAAGMTEQMAKLMSAAPELLEAVQAVAHQAKTDIGIGDHLRRLIERALRKVESGQPEEP